MVDSLFVGIGVTRPTHSRSLLQGSGPIPLQIDPAIDIPERPLIHNGVSFRTIDAAFLLYGI